MKAPDPRRILLLLFETGFLMAELFWHCIGRQVALLAGLKEEDV